MPDYKVTFKFSGQNAGWTETFWINQGLISLAAARARSLAISRMQLCGAELNIQLDDTVVESAPEATIAEYQPSDELFVSAGAYKTSPADTPWTGALIDIRTDLRARRSFVMRGVPDAVTVSPYNVPVPNPSWQILFNAWRILLLQDGWELRRIDRTAGPLRTITGMLSAVDGTLTVTAPLHGAHDGDSIIWYRIDATGACFRGVAPVLVVDANTLKLPQYNVGTIKFESGQLRVAKYAYARITDATVLRKAERPTGGSHNTIKARRVKCKR